MEVADESCEPEPHATPSRQPTVPEPRRRPSDPGPHAEQALDREPEQAPLGDVRAERTALGAGGVAEVSRELIDGEWQVTGSGRWSRTEHIVTLEGRALVHGLRTRIRDTSTFGKRMLFLSDSLVAVLALSKGRSGAWGLLRVARQWAAITLAWGADVRLRWLPSELKPADAPSRR